MINGEFSLQVFLYSCPVFRYTFSVVFDDTPPKEKRHQSLYRPSPVFKNGIILHSVLRGVTTVSVLNQFLPDLSLFSYLTIQKRGLLGVARESPSLFSFFHLQPLSYHLIIRFFYFQKGVSSSFVVRSLRGRDGIEFTSITTLHLLQNSYLLSVYSRRDIRHSV